MKEEPKLVTTAITIWGMTRTTTKPRPRCSECGKPCNVARIDSGRIVVGKKKAGRPKKGQRKTRYTVIGHWCKQCDIFYYLDGTPNYKLHLRGK